MSGRPVGGRALRVGVDLLFLRPGEVGGSEEYTVRGLTALAERAAPDIEPVLFVLEPFRHAHPDLAAAFPTEVLRSRGRPRPVRVAAQSTWLARRVRRLDLDLVHHAGGTVPPVRAAPALLTIHDLQPLELPEHFSPLKRAYIRLAVPRSARAARLVVTPSEAARRSVVSLLGVPDDRTAVVPHGIDVAGLDPTPSAADRAVAARLGVDGPFFLFPAIPYPHKGHAVLVEALGRARHAEAHLVLTGGPGPEDATLAAAVERAGLGDRVHRTGRVPRPELEALYRTAAAVAFPSRYEGFGNPVLEAMGHGCPVLAADATALPEVVADAGVLLPPDDPQAWADAMDRLLDQPAERRRLAAAGRERAGAFPWSRTADALVDAYRRVGDQR